jgi:methylthioribulose-1-phosphate dehydratase
MTTDIRNNLSSCATHFYRLGLMMGTAGNLSAKLTPDSFWITASGKNKGNLELDDFLLLDLEGNILKNPNPNNRPSAETSIHQTIYRLFPQANACYHVHSVEANLVSRLTKEDSLKLPSIEMLKGLGIWQENPNISLALFENFLSVPQISESIAKRFESSLPEVNALLIRDHGVTVWAESTQSALNYIEVIEYLFRYILLTAQNPGLFYDTQ